MTAQRQQTGPHPSPPEGRNDVEARSSSQDPTVRRRPTPGTRPGTREIRLSSSTTNQVSNHPLGMSRRPSHREHARAGHQDDDLSPEHHR